MAGKTGDSPSRARAPNATTLVVCWFMASILFVLAVPRLLGALTVAPATATQNGLAANMTVEEGSIREFIVLSHKAAGISNDPAAGLAAANGRLELYRAELRQGRPNPERLRPAIAELESALARAPANPAAWSELTVALAFTGADPARIARAYSMSVLTGPQELHLTAARLYPAMNHWPSLDERTRALVLQDIRQGFAKDGRKLTRLLAGTMLRRSILRAALSDDPESLMRLESFFRESGR